MRLPDADRAFIDSIKVTHYLLSADHPVGRAKSQFFRRVGFSPYKPDQLTHALRRMACSGVVVRQVATVFGSKYIVDGELKTPVGWVVKTRSVWIVRKSGTPPHFVTAYPR
jgi:hypothetical protein